MTGTEELITKWTAQGIALREKAETLAPGQERESLLYRAELCSRAIDAAETLTHFTSASTRRMGKGALSMGE